MKTLMLFVVAMFSVALCHSDEPTGNPDRYASVGLEVTNGTLDGNGESTEYLYWPGGVTNVPVADKNTNELKMWSIYPSFRMPASDRLTVEIGVRYVHQEYAHTGYLTRFKGKVSGELYTLGFRYYLP
jgi:hypothetical protein